MARIRSRDLHETDVLMFKKEEFKKLWPEEEPGEWRWYGVKNHSTTETVELWWASEAMVSSAIQTKPVKDEKQ